MLEGCIKIGDGHLHNAVSYCATFTIFGYMLRRRQKVYSRAQDPDFTTTVRLVSNLPKESRMMWETMLLG